MSNIRIKTGKLRLGVLLSGRGSNMAAIAESIQSGKLDAEIAVVVSNRAAAEGLEKADQMGVSTETVSAKEYPIREEHDAAVVEILRSHEVELVILAGYMRIVTPTLLQAFPNRVMNIHPSLLPSFPGLEGQRQAWDYGVKVSGCTVHFVSEGVDEGPIILQRTVPVLNGEDANGLAARILVEEHHAFSEAIALFAADRLRLEGRRVVTVESDGRKR